MTVSTRKEFDKLKEAPLRRDIIIPLLQKMGMRDVRENHGPTELGKDIVFWYLDPLETAVNVVVVAKAGNVTGKAVTEVARQAEQAFRTTFATGLDNIERSADMVWVVTNGSIPEMSRKSVQSQVARDFQDRIRWLDGDELWKRWIEHFPVTLEQIRSQLQAHVTQISDEAITAREWVGEGSRGVEFFVKDASKLTPRHTDMNLSFSFPETPEGQEAMEKWLRHIRTGEPVQFSGEHFKLRLPEVLEGVLQDSYVSGPDDFSTITISSVESPHRFPVRVDVVCDDGDQATLEYIEWRVLQSGTEETTFINDEQAIPLRFKMVFPNFAGEGRYDLYREDDPMSATWIKRWMDLQRCLCKPGVIKVTLLNSGIELSPSRHNVHQELQFNQDDYDFIVAMAQVEQITGQQIFIPDQWTEEDLQVLELLDQLLRNPEGSVNWNGGSTTAIADESDPLMQLWLNGGETRLLVAMPRSASLAGRPLRLGTVELTFESVKLADVEETKRRIEAVSSPDEEISIRVVPGESRTLHMRYLDWIGAQSVSLLRQEQTEKDERSSVSDMNHDVPDESAT